MKSLLLFSILSALALPVAHAAPDAMPSRPFLLDKMKQVVDFQMKEFGDTLPLCWQAGTFFTGVTAAYNATGYQPFHDIAMAWSEKAQWKTAGKPFFADDICIAQTYLDLYQIHKDPRMVADIQAKLEPYFGKKFITEQENAHISFQNVPQVFRGRNVWWWCDALYMAPPVLTRLYAITGDQRYLTLLHELYWDTVEHLYVPEDQLFLRDRFYIDARSPKGKNVYWSRGNGWVYAGLVRLLDYLPESDPRRADYLHLYRVMTDAILRYQGADGLWRTSLSEPDWYPDKESSGTAFFTYGLLSGIRRGWLPADRYLAPALKGWNGLLTCVTPEGKLGHAQGVNREPGPVDPNKSIDYAHGAFLLAASELYKMAPEK